jgi:hypothetical protein
MQTIQRFDDFSTSDVIFPIDMQFSLPAGDLAHDRAILRDLAGQIIALAGQPIESEKEGLWRAHNQLKPVRPLVFCDPEIGWNEIIMQDDLHCQEPMLREIEWLLRRDIFWGTQMKDDRVINPYFAVPLIHDTLDWGLHEVRHGGENGGAYIWDAPIKTAADIQHMHFPQIGVDFTASRARKEFLNDLFGDLLPVQEKTFWWWTLGLSEILARLRGLEQMMFDMLDAPQIIHQIMAILRDGTLHMLDELERLGLLSTNHQGDYVGSGGFGWTDELPAPGFSGSARTKDMWGFAESQETIGISPKMFAEMIFPYQMPILERFGLNCYGCCEPVDLRWKYIKDIPRLRRVSVSPWSDRVKMAQLLEDRFVFSLKVPPSDFAPAQFDEDSLRSNLRKELETLRGCRLEIILKDVTTIRNDPRRVTRWVEIVREEIDRLW